MSKKSYYVTDAGGPRPSIAGYRAKAWDKIVLTDAEAEFELSRGMIITPEEYEKRQGNTGKAEDGSDPAPKKGK